MMKGYKIRLFPTKEQEENFWEHIHTCRFIWNYMLNIQKETYFAGNKYIKKFDVLKMITSLKQKDEYVWLKNVSNKSLEIVCTDLDQRFMRLFNHIDRWPKFKSRKYSKPSYPIRTDNSLRYKDGKIGIEKVGYVKIKGNIPDGKKYNARISFVNNKWILSFCIDYEKQVTIQHTDKSMGIDLGIKELAVVSFGDEKIVFHNINKSQKIKKLEHKLKHIDRVISRKYRVNHAITGTYNKTKNIMKYEKIFKEINYRLSNIRTDYIHKTTHELVSLCPTTIIMEDLNLKEMGKIDILPSH